MNIPKEISIDLTNNFAESSNRAINKHFSFDVLLENPKKLKENPKDSEIDVPDNSKPSSTDKTLIPSLNDSTSDQPSNSNPSSSTTSNTTNNSNLPSLYDTFNTSTLENTNANTQILTTIFLLKPRITRKPRNHEFNDKSTIE
eukprot:TRINITY_DN5668_c0_g1_i1.p1 TRINITY_DN5668_c0_g1~~TRINITY_DN5668_c0_g1_i1.p1  ORF type:complete len:143 (+),score=45.28 TRINITY_DN5668_c0_g1_i1:603-1031(+)